jgi:hypothetical protein
MVLDRDFDYGPHVRPLGALPYAKGSQTSKAAAERAEPHAKGDAERVLAFIRSRGKYGATCDECELTLSLRHQTASARINGLRFPKEGPPLIASTTATRPTRSGAKAVVYVAIEFVEAAKPGDEPVALQEALPL